MRHAERVILYSGLALSLALGAGLHLSSPAQAGHEQPAATMKIASVDMIDISLKMFGSATNTKARQALQEKMGPLGFELQGMQQKLQGMQQAKQEASPEFQTLLKMYQEKGQVYQQSQNEFELLQVKQVSDSFAAAVAAADTVATRLGYTNVIASKPARSAFVANNMQGIIQDFLVRPVIKEGPTDNITEAVIKELNIEPPLAAPSAPAGGPAAGQPPAPAGPQVPAAQPVPPKAAPAPAPAPKP